MGFPRHAGTGPLGISCKDPRSQKRDLGHPSVCTDGSWVIPVPTRPREAPRDDKGEGSASRSCGCRGMEREPRVIRDFINFCPVTALHGSAALPFVIPTEAQRSGGICSSAHLSWKCFFDRLYRIYAHSTSRSTLSTFSRNSATSCRSAATSASR